MWRSIVTPLLTSFWLSSFLGLCPPVGYTACVVGNIPRLHRIYYVHHTYRILCHFSGNGGDVCACGGGGVYLLNLISSMIDASAHFSLTFLTLSESVRILWNSAYAVNVCALCALIKCRSNCEETSPLCESSYFLNLFINKILSLFLSFSLFIAPSLP